MMISKTRAVSMQVLSNMVRAEMILFGMDASERLDRVGGLVPRDRAPGPIVPMGDSSDPTFRHSRAPRRRGAPPLPPSLDGNVGDGTIPSVREIIFRHKSTVPQLTGEVSGTVVLAYYRSPPCSTSNTIRILLRAFVPLW